MRASRTKQRNNSASRVRSIFRPPTVGRWRSGPHNMDEAEDEIGRRGEEAAPQVSGAAWSLLGAASREKADTFLDEQIAIARLQKEHLHEQRDLLIAQLTGEVGLLNLKRFDEKLGIGLKLL